MHTVCIVHIVYIGHICADCAYCSNFVVVVIAVDDVGVVVLYRLVREAWDMGSFQRVTKHTHTQDFSDPLRSYRTLKKTQTSVWIAYEQNLFH